MDCTTRPAAWRRFLLSLLAAATLALAPGSAGAFAAWDDTQELDIDANGFTQVLFFDFETSDIRLSSIGFGDREVTYFLNDSEGSNDYDFVGAFLFDYTDGKFTADFYATASNEFGS